MTHLFKPRFNIVDCFSTAVCTYMFLRGEIALGIASVLIFATVSAYFEHKLFK